MVWVCEGLLALVVVGHVLGRTQVEVERVYVVLLFEGLELRLEPWQGLVVRDIQDPSAVDVPVSGQSWYPGVTATLGDEEPIADGFPEVLGLGGYERLDRENYSETSSVYDVDGILHGLEARLVQDEVTRAWLPFLAKKDVTLA